MIDEGYAVVAALTVNQLSVDEGTSDAVLVGSFRCARRGHLRLRRARRLDGHAEPALAVKLLYRGRRCKQATQAGVGGWVVGWVGGWVVEWVDTK